MFFPFVFAMRMPIKNNSRYLFVFCFELRGREREKNDVAICKCDDAKIESKFFSGNGAFLVWLSNSSYRRMFFFLANLSLLVLLWMIKHTEVFGLLFNNKKTIAHDCDLIWPHSLTFLKNSK